MIVDLIKNKCKFVIMYLKVIVYYHMNPGEISPGMKEYPRETMTSYSKLSDNG